jgi:hypothetical protein
VKISSTSFPVKRSEDVERSWTEVAEPTDPTKDEDAGRPNDEADDEDEAATHDSFSGKDS